MSSERTEPKHSDFDPEIELIIAVYRRAGLDAVYGRGATRLLADWFLRLEGFDPAAVRRAWAGREKPIGRPRRVN